MSDSLIVIFSFICIVIAVIALIAGLAMYRSMKKKTGKKQDISHKEPEVYYEQPVDTRYEGEYEIVTPWKAAGNEGEWIAEGRISSILWEDDHYYRNIRITHEGGRAEIDILIVNHNGVFVIEVKNWSGIISGRENDHTLRRVKNVQGEDIEEYLDNPLEQAEKTAGLLGKLLRTKEIDVHAEAYVYFVRENYLGNSDRILANVQEIDRLIHSSSGQHYDNEKIDAIASWADGMPQKPRANWIRDL